MELCHIHRLRQLECMFWFKPIIRRYLTFENDDDALHCIEAVDGFCYKNHILKSFDLIINHS